MTPQRLPYDKFVVQFDGVVKTYKTPHGDVHALSDVTFSVNPDFVFLVGASGSGKSTILRLLIKEENVTEGDIVVANANLGSFYGKERHSSAAPTSRNSFSRLQALADRTIFDNVAFGLKVLGRPSSEIAPDGYRSATHGGKFGDKSDRYPNELSVGNSSAP